MNISKTMFKNFARCRNFVSYYDLYINRFLHEVKEIDGTPVITEELLKEMKDIPEGMFDELFIQNDLKYVVDKINEYYN